MPPRQVANAWSFIKELVAEYQKSHVPQVAASLAYFTMFSLSPLLIIAIGIAGNFFGRSTVQQQVVEWARQYLTPRTADMVAEMVSSYGGQGSGIVATVVGSVLLIVGASRLFVQLQIALNGIWGVKPKGGRGVKGVVLQRAFSLLLVLVTGLLLLVLLSLSIILAAAVQFFQQYLPLIENLLTLGDFVLAWAVATLVFALIFKYVPDVDIAWHDVRVGAAVTALLFSIGRYLLGLYLGKATFGSMYGAAGSFVVFLFWLYVSAQIFLIGSKFTQVYARRRGERIQPDRHAVRVTVETRTEDDKSGT
ncbi:MAG: YihY family inner membrane protein [Chitinivibrionales bacterium]|nr:YihY family inner membrane protein [Chitinivibrionales bacterium]